MYLMYVDESGDPGLNNSPTRYFILSGIVVHELRWQALVSDILGLRRYFKNRYKLKISEEIHASLFVNGSSELSSIKRNERLDILKRCIDFLSGRNDISVITVRVDKTGKAIDIFELAWAALIQRFENTINYKNFQGPSNPDEKGIILPDNTDGEKLTKLVRKMRHYNPVPNRTDVYGAGNRNLALNYVIEDPFLKNSRTSFLSQMADVVAYFAKQKYAPNSYIKKKAGANYYDRLGQVLLTKASPKHPQGIVEL